VILSPTQHYRFKKLYEIHAFSHIREIMKIHPKILKQHMYFLNITRTIDNGPTFIKKEQIPLFLSYAGSGMPLKKISEALNIPFGRLQKARQSLYYLGFLPRFLFQTWTPSMQASILRGLDKKRDIKGLAEEFKVSAIEIEKMKRFKNRLPQISASRSLDEFDEFINRGVEGIEALSENLNISYDQLLGHLQAVGLVTRYQVITGIDKIKLPYEDIEVVAKLNPLYTPAFIASALGKGVDQIKGVMETLSLEKKYSFDELKFKPTAAEAKRLKALKDYPLEDISLATGFRKNVLTRYLEQEYYILKHFEDDKVEQTLSVEETIEVISAIGQLCHRRIIQLSQILTAQCTAVIVGLEHHQVRAILNYKSLRIPVLKAMKQDIDYCEFMAKLREDVGGVREIMKAYREMQTRMDIKHLSKDFISQLNKLAINYTILEITILMNWSIDKTRKIFSRYKIKVSLRKMDKFCRIA